MGTRPILRRGIVNALDSGSSPDPARRLPEALHHRMREAILARWREDPEADAALASAISALAAEARQRGLRPEELIIFLKALEDEIPIPSRRDQRVSFEERRRFREWLVSTSLESYFRG
jgi:hypothetical protein